MIPRSVTCALLVLAASAACENTGAAPQAHEPAVRYTLSRVAASDPAVELSAVGAMAVDTRGQIYVADGQRRVVVLGPAGGARRVIGRGGAGPGEFTSIEDLFILSDDRLLVLDAVLSRATVFRPNSSELDHTEAVGHAPGEIIVQAAAARDGRLLTHSVRAHGPMADPSHRNDVVRIQAGEGREHAILTLSPNQVLRMDLQGAMGFFMPRFASRRIVRLSRGRVYSAWSDSSAVRVFDGNGRQVGSILPAALQPGRRISDREYDSVAASFGDAALARRARPLLRSRWKTWPVIDNLLVDDRGGVWIKPVRRDGRNQWVHHDDGGALVGSLELPERVTPRLIVGGRLYCVEKDTLDVPRVVVYALRTDAAHPSPSHVPAPSARVGTARR